MALVFKPMAARLGADTALDVAQIQQCSCHRRKWAGTAGGRAGPRRRAGPGKHVKWMEFCAAENAVQLCADSETCLTTK